MTQVVAWHRGSEIYVFADTVLTGSSALGEEWSVFGERLCDRSGRWLLDTMMKITRFRDCAVAFAGLASKGVSLAKAMRAEINRGLSPRDAFEVAVRSISPLECTTDLQALCAWRESARPNLLTFNVGGCDEIRSHTSECVVQLGSVTQDLCQSTIERLAAFANERRITDRSRFAVSLALLQTRAFLDHLPSDNIGGALAACAIDAQGLRWQPSISYTPMPSTKQSGFLVTTLVRRDALIVHTSLRDAPEILVAEQSDGTPELIRNWSTFGASVQRLVEFPRRDYFCLFNHATRSTVLVEMARKLDGRLLKIRPRGLAPEQGKYWLGASIAIHPSISKALDSPSIAHPTLPGVWSTGLHFFPAEPVRQADIPDQFQ